MLRYAPHRGAEKLHPAVKASHMVSSKHLKGLRLISEEIPFKHKIVVSLDQNPRVIEDILVLPYQEFLSRLWNRAF